MKCDYCKKDFAMPLLRFVEAGMVPGIVGMKRHRAQCQPCSKAPKKIAIDETSQNSREPGSDDELPKDYVPNEPPF